MDEKTLVILDTAGFKFVELTEEEKVEFIRNEELREARMSAIDPAYMDDDPERYDGYVTGNGTAVFEDSLPAKLEELAPQLVLARHQRTCFGRFLIRVAWVVLKVKGFFRHLFS